MQYFSIFLTSNWNFWPSLFTFYCFCTHCLNLNDAHTIFALSVNIWMTGDATKWCISNSTNFKWWREKRNRWKYVGKSLIFKLKNRNIPQYLVVSCSILQNFAEFHRILQNFAEFRRISIYFFERFFLSVFKDISIE